MPLAIMELIGIGKGGFGGYTPFDIFLYVLTFCTEIGIFDRFRDRKRGGSSIP